MNKNLSTILKLITLVVALLLVAGCKKAPIQETQVTETVAVTETIEVLATTVPEETEVIETEPPVTAPEAGSITYEEYLELTVEEQQVYYGNFKTADEFFAWFDKAKLEYEEAMKPSEVVGSTGNNQEETGPVEVVQGIFVEEELGEWE